MMNVLGLPRADPSKRIEVWAEDVVLGLSDDDAKRLARLAKVRKDEEAWEYERRYERSVRSYLSDDVFTSQGSAAVWWLAGPRTDEKQRVDEAVAKLDHLRVLTRVASGEGNPETPLDEPAEHVGFRAAPALVSSHLFAPSMTNGHGEEPFSLGGSATSVVEFAADGPERAMFARQLADLLEVQGHHDVAQEMRGRFDAPMSQELDDEPAESEEVDQPEGSEEGEPELPVQGSQREDSPPEAEPHEESAERSSSSEERTSE